MVSVKKMHKILIIEDELSMRLGLRFTLEDAGFVVSVAETGSSGMELVEKEKYHMIITDFRLPDYNGIEILARVKTVSPETCVIVITAFAEIENAVKAIKLGAFDYIQKPFEPSKLLEIIERFFENSEFEKQLFPDPQKGNKRCVTENFGILGKGSSVKKVFEFINAAAKSDSSVMIFGESGTGKELVANAIHHSSNRSKNSLIKINSASIPAELLEAELCGYEKGAFTGAFQQKKGKLEMAHGGTFFFDEIGDMPFNMQTKLLRIIENKSFERLGGNSEIKVDTRFIFATRMNISGLIAKGSFREDLYYRINVLSITLPQLKERKEDILVISRYYTEFFCKKLFKPIPEFNDDFIDFLHSYDFPGNIRELKHMIENIVTFSKGDKITVEHIPDDIIAKHEHFEKSFFNKQLDSNVRDMEKITIINALNRFSWKKNEAAEFLGISRATLWRKMKELSIEKF